MNFNFSGYSLRDGGYSEKPMTMLDPEPRAMLSGIMEIALVETGNRSAREHWQRVQLRNLLTHVARRSAFWRSRIGNMRISDIDLTELPILTRQDLRTQVASEGPLLRPGDGLAAHEHATSGSSGIPVRFFYSDFNARYNSARSLAQFFLEGRDPSLNRTRIRGADGPVKCGISVVKQGPWIGSLAQLIRSGGNKHIEHYTLDKENCHRLVQELQKDDIGYLVAVPSTVATIAASFDLGLLKAARIAMWIPLAGKPDPKVVETFGALGIPVRANYSSEEVGMIAVECSKFAGHYHVATSNVIVEVVDQKLELDGAGVGNVLVTHLHSYATPFIRYEVGDLACLRAKCLCGRDAPTIYNLEGRASGVLKHRDGRLSRLFVRSKELTAIAEFSEYRMRQTAFDRIVIELGGRSELKAEEIAAVTALVQEQAGPEFDVEVKACERIDWGQSRKRPAFRCEI
jgi:phenylacetate-coenzyme A ligase PaaK-like adenylate-forming protein